MLRRPKRSPIYRNQLLPHRNTILMPHRLRMSKKWRIWAYCSNQKSHSSHTSMRSLWNQSYKFSKELHAPQVNLKIVCTYLLPIIEYVPLIWFPQRKKVIKSLEKSLRFASRTPHCAWFTVPQRPSELSFLRSAPDQSWIDINRGEIPDIRYHNGT